MERKRGVKVVAQILAATVGSMHKGFGGAPRTRKMRLNSILTPPAGLEPTTFGLQVQGTIHCAKRDAVVNCAG